MTTLCIDIIASTTNAEAIQATDSYVDLFSNFDSVYCFRLLSLPPRLITFLEDLLESAIDHEFIVVSRSLLSDFAIVSRSEQATPFVMLCDHPLGMMIELLCVDNPRA